MDIDKPEAAGFMKFKVAAIYTHIQDDNFYEYQSHQQVLQNTQPPIPHHQELRGRIRDEIVEIDHTGKGSTRVRARRRREGGTRARVAAALRARGWQRGARARRRRETPRQALEP